MNSMPRQIDQKLRAFVGISEIFGVARCIISDTVNSAEGSVCHSNNTEVSSLIRTLNKFLFRNL